MTFQERQLKSMAKSLKNISETLHVMNSEKHTQFTPDVCGHVDDCAFCQCSTCANRETCKLKNDEVLTDIKASPCNGCRPGERFRPVEAKRCPKYSEVNDNALPLQSFEHGACV